MRGLFHFIYKEYVWPVYTWLIFWYPVERKFRQKPITKEVGINGADGAASVKGRGGIYEIIIVFVLCWEWVCVGCRFVFFYNWKRVKQLGDNAGDIPTEQHIIENNSWKVQRYPTFYIYIFQSFWNNKIFLWVNNIIMQLDVSKLCVRRGSILVFNNL